MMAQQDVFLQIQTHVSELVAKLKLYLQPRWLRLSRRQWRSHDIYTSICGEWYKWVCSLLSEAGYELKSGPTLLQVAIKCFSARADDETLAAQLPWDLSCFLFLL